MKGSVSKLFSLIALWGKGRFNFKDRNINLNSFSLIECGETRGVSKGSREQGHGSLALSSGLTGSSALYKMSLQQAEGKSLF